MSARSFRRGVRVWPLLALGLTALLAVPPNAAETAVRPVAVQGWLAEGLDGGGSDSSGSDSSGSDDSGGETEVASGPDNGSDDSGGESGGGAPDVDSGPKDSPSDDSSGEGSGNDPDVVATPKDGPSDSSSGDDVDVTSAPDRNPSDSASASSDTAIPEMVPASDSSSGESDPIPEFVGTGGESRPDAPDGTVQAATVDPAGAAPTNADGSPAAPDAPADPAQTIAAGPRPATEPGQSAVAGPVPTAPGQGTDPAATAAAGKTYYQNLLKSDGPAARDLRTLDPAQIDQLAEAGPPQTAEQVVDLVTGIPAAEAAPGTVEEDDRNERLRKWFGDSFDRPGDFDAFASALPPDERAKLEQRFEEYKPSMDRGGISLAGRQVSNFLRDLNEQGLRDNPSNFIPGSWPDRIEKSGNRFIEGIPEGLATSFEHLLLEDPTAELIDSDNPRYQRLIGESDEHYEQRLRPFSHDLRATGQAYADDLKPIVTDGDFSKFKQRFHDDPVGGAAMYAPVGLGAGKLLSRTGGSLVRSGATRLRGSPKLSPGKTEPGAPEGTALAAGAPEGAAPQSVAAAAGGPEARAPENGAATAAGGPEARAPESGTTAASGGAEGRAPESGGAVARTGEGRAPETVAPAAGAADATEKAGAPLPAAVPQVREPGASPVQAGTPVAAGQPRPSVSESGGPYAAAPSLVEPGAGSAISGNVPIQDLLKSGDEAKLAEALAPRRAGTPPLAGKTADAGKADPGAAGRDKLAQGDTPGLDSCLNSFTATTLVLMADGSRKPIKDVARGNKVLATDPVTGERGPREVTDLIRHGGMHTMVAVQLAGAGQLDATDKHPFWVASQRKWVDAIDLKPGDVVLSDRGDQIKVTNLKTSQQDLTAYNLTVAGLHTYYVGNKPVLVHNAKCPTGLNNASDGLKGLFEGGSVRGKPIAEIRAGLLKNGFTQTLSNNKKGYLFRKNGSQEEVRIMRRNGGWDIRMRNNAGNNLDEFGNDGLPNVTHGIQVTSR
jgi:hypothetical protein